MMSAILTNILWLKEKIGTRTSPTAVQKLLITL